MQLPLQNLFESPTVAELAITISLLRQQQSLSISATPAIALEPFSLISIDDRLKVPDDVVDAYPLTRLQAGMLFHSEYHSDSALYQNINGFFVKQRFDHASLQLAIQNLTAAHPILRTAFDLSKYSEPLQLVHEAVEVPIEVDDLRELTTPEQQKTLAEWFEAEKSRKFVWDHAPLMRLHVHLVSDEMFQLTITEHHAIIDGWSMSIFLTTLFKNYFYLLQGEPIPEEPPLKSQFRDFVALERAAVESEECRQYWTQTMSDSTQTLLPRLPNPPQTSTRRYPEYVVPLPSDMSEGLKQLAKFAGVPLKSALLAAHLKVLSLLSGQQDVVTGLVSNGRPEDSDGERVLGLFLNTLPFRQELKGGTWKDLVRETFANEVKAIPFRRYPLAQIQKLQGGSSPFEAVFNFTFFNVYQEVMAPKDNEQAQLIGGQFFQETNFTFSANFGLDPSSNFVQCMLQYDAAEFSSEHIKAIGEYYVRTLTDMIAQPAARYERALLLSQPEQDLISQWNQTAVAYPIGKNVHELFEEQAEQHAGQLAIADQEEQFTYQKLNERANQLAHYLQSLDIRPETRVGLCVEEINGNVRRHARHLEGRRRLCPTRSGISQRASVFHVRGRGRQCAAHSGTTAQTTARTTVAGHLHGS